jgi:hypothetical protein
VLNVAHMDFAFPTPGFRGALIKGEGAWRLVCEGVLDARDAAALVQPELLKLHASLVEEKISTVRLEIANVEYINSSGLKSFMAWFLAASNLKENRYSIEVEYDQGSSWQQLSLRPMERLAPNTVKLLPRVKPS